MLKPEAGASAAKELRAGSQAVLPEHLATAVQLSEGTMLGPPRGSQGTSRDVMGNLLSYKFPDEKML